MWHRPYIVKRVFKKGVYELIYYEGNPLNKPHNGLYLKRYYAYNILYGYLCTLVCDSFMYSIVLCDKISNNPPAYYDFLLCIYLCLHTLVSPMVLVVVPGTYNP